MLFRSNRPAEVPSRHAPEETGGLEAPEGTPAADPIRLRDLDARGALRWARDETVTRLRDGAAAVHQSTPAHRRAALWLGVGTIAVILAPMVHALLVLLLAVAVIDWQMQDRAGGSLAGMLFPDAPRADTADDAEESDAAAPSPAAHPVWVAGEPAGDATPGAGWRDAA